MNGQHQSQFNTETIAALGPQKVDLQQEYLMLLVLKSKNPYQT